MASSESQFGLGFVAKRRSLTLSLGHEASLNVKAPPIASQGRSNGNVRRSLRCLLDGAFEPTRRPRGCHQSTTWNKARIDVWASLVSIYRASSWGDFRAGSTSKVLAAQKELARETNPDRSPMPFCANPKRRHSLLFHEPFPGERCAPRHL